jgi:hypothetical protein
VEKSRGCSKQTFILVTHDVSDVGRQSRLEGRVLQYLELLPLQIVIEKASLSILNAAVNTLAVKSDLGHNFVIAGSAHQLIFLRVGFGLLSESWMATKHLGGEVMALSILLKNFEGGQAHLLD